MNWLHDLLVAPTIAHSVLIIAIVAATGSCSSAARSV
jgi:hypothetical protein